MNKLQRKAVWIEFKSDVIQFGFLTALNNLSFDIGHCKTNDFTLERDIVYFKYKLRKAKIDKLKSKLKRG